MSFSPILSERAALCFEKFAFFYMFVKEHNVAFWKSKSFDVTKLAIEL